MNNESDNHVLNNDAPSNEMLQKNLINALTKLQHTAFEKNFLDEDLSSEMAKPESFFGFSIGQHHFMVAASCFCEVFSDAAIAAVPNSPDCLMGLSNIRGVLMPVYQLHKSLAVESPKKPIIFAVGKGDSAVGLLVDTLPVLLSLSANQRQPNSSHSNAFLQFFVKENYIANQLHWLLLQGNEFGSKLLSVANQTHKSNLHLNVNHDAIYS